MRTTKDHDQYLRRLRRQGYATRVNPSGHVQVYDPAGCLVATHSGSSSDWRSLKNLKAEIQRHQCPAERREAATA